MGCVCVCVRERERERERKREIQKRSPRIWRIILFREKPEVYNNGKLCNNKKKKGNLAICNHMDGSRGY